MADEVRPQELEETHRAREKARYVYERAYWQMRTFDLIVLVLSVVTSGSLWVAVQKEFPVVAVWVAAILSTLTAILTGFSRQRGHLQIAVDAAALRKQLTSLLADLAANPKMERSQYRDPMKRIEEDVALLVDKTGIKIPEEVLRTRVNAAMGKRT